MDFLDNMCGIYILNRSFFLRFTVAFPVLGRKFFCFHAAKTPLFILLNIEHSLKNQKIFRFAQILLPIA
jgi:hypothetical protein